MNTQTLEKKSADEIVNKPEYKRIARPLIDLYETNEGFVLLADLPGVRSEDLEVTVEKKVLTLKGLVKRPSREGFKHVTSDRPVTVFERGFRLSDEIDREAIEAVLSHGVLKLTLKKIAPAQKKTIEIKSHS
jgi:HSP20 family protein